MSGRLFHAPFIAAHPYFKLYGVVERHTPQAQSLYPEAKHFSSVAEGLADPVIDLVVVNTPVQTHYEYTRAALLVGKHVLVEKPFTVNVDEAADLVRLAAEKALSLTVYQNRRYDGDFLKVKEIVTSGVLGDLKQVEMRFDRFRPTLSAKAHKETAEAGGGTLHDLGAHLIDQALVLFGTPQRIAADLGYMREGTLTNDYFEILLHYPKELRVRLISTTFALERQWEYKLHGTKGSFLQQRFDAQEEALDKGEKPSFSKWLPKVSAPNGILHTLDKREETTAQQGNYMHFYEALYQHLACGAKNPVPATEALEVIRVIDLSKNAIFAV